jgi:hypothetical protein
VPADPSSVATAIIKRGVRYYGLDHIGGTYGNMSLSPFKLDDDSTAAATMREDRESNSISIDS